METILVNKRKRIALVAHDNMKKLLLNWVGEHLDDLKKHELFGTGTTSSLIRNEYNLEITSFLSGPMGGDQQLGSSIALNLIDLIIFFWDPLQAQPHEPDVRALLRIAVLYDVPVAQSISSANYFVSSPLFNQEYEKYVFSNKENLEKRVNHFSK